MPQGRPASAGGLHRWAAPEPAEDCGGVYGYELIAAAIDPTRTDHAEAVAEYARCFGDDADPVWFSPTLFDIDKINNTLADLGLGGTSAQTDLPEQLNEHQLAHPLAQWLHIKHAYRRSVIAARSGYEFRNGNSGYSSPPSIAADHHLAQRAGVAQSV